MPNHIGQRLDRKLRRFSPPSDHAPVGIFCETNYSKKQHPFLFDTFQSRL